MSRSRLRPLRRVASAALLVLYGAQVTVAMSASCEQSALCAKMGMPAMDGHGTPAGSHHQSQDSTPMSAPTHCPLMPGTCVGCAVMAAVVAPPATTTATTPVAVVASIATPAFTAAAPEPPPPRA